MQMSPNARQLMLLSVLYFTLIFFYSPWADVSCVKSKQAISEYGRQRKSDAPTIRAGERHRKAIIPCFSETAFCKFGSERQMGKKVFRKIVAVCPASNSGRKVLCANLNVKDKTRLDSAEALRTGTRPRA